MRRRNNKTRKQMKKGGANCRIGMGFAKFGGAGCGCGSSGQQQQQLQNLATGIKLGPITANLKGGACPCQAIVFGGRRKTKRNYKNLNK